MRRALALASLLHLAAVATMGGLATTTGPTTAPAPAITSAVLVEVELDQDPAPELARGELAAPQPAATSHVSEAPRAAPRAPSTGSDSMTAAVIEAEEGDATVDPESEPAPSDHRAVDLGLGPDAWRTWASATRADAKPSSRKKRDRKSFRAPPASTTGGLQEGLEARDRELGLGPSGPVIGAFYRAAHSDVAPQLGTAHFRVTLFSSGAVEVSVMSATDRTAGWSAVAARAAEALRATPQRIPPRREGVTMVLELKAESVFPNGVRRNDLKGPHLEAVAPRLRSAEEAQADLQRSNPTAKEGDPPLILDQPGVYLAETGKVCSYRLGISTAGPVLSGGCDLSNIGAKAQRMVHARVIQETVF